MPPLGTQTWVEDCVGTLGDRPITLSLAPPSSPPMPPAAPPAVYPLLVLSGLCPEHASATGAYSLQGTSGSGAPYYANANGNILYYDLSCDGMPSGQPMWVLAPAGTRLQIGRSHDVDDDRTLTHTLATLAISAPSAPPIPPLPPRSPMPPSEPPQPPIAPLMCIDQCKSSADGDCDDGGPGSILNIATCLYGLDCSDCGPRAPRPPSPPQSPLPPYTPQGLVHVTTIAQLRHLIRYAEPLGLVSVYISPGSVLSADIMEHSINVPAITLQIVSDGIGATFDGGDMIVPHIATAVLER
eukprot:3684747-Prymnesium_polylepis.1